MPKIDTSSSLKSSDLSIPQLPFTNDCLPILNWRGDELVSEHEKAIVFRSLVAAVKSQPAVDVSVEIQAVKFLQYIDPHGPESANAFLSRLASSTDESLTDFVQCIMVLISSASEVITMAAMKTLKSLFFKSSPKKLLALVKAGLIPELVINLNPQSLSSPEAVHTHTYLLSSIAHPVRLTTPYYLSQLGIEDDDEQQAIYETVFKQVLSPSEKYISHLCVNRFSIVDGDMSKEFMILLARLLQISTCHQPALAVVLNMPVFLTIPSCLTFFEKENSIYFYLFEMINFQWNWNTTSDNERQIGKTVHRMLRMEGIEDVIEEKQRNDRKTDFGNLIVASSIEWNKLQSMNLPEPW